MPDAKRRFELLKQKGFFGFMLLADADFSAYMLKAKEALRGEDGLAAIALIRKAETLYDSVNWSDKGEEPTLDDSPASR